MIRSISIDNFKSLRNFRLDLDKVTCLVGLNGAGKSTVLQALSFLTSAMLGQTTEWLHARKWKLAELQGALPPVSANPQMTFSVVMDAPSGFLRWIGIFDVSKGPVRCVSETVEQAPTADFETSDTVRIWEQDGRAHRRPGQSEILIGHHFSGSVLGTLIESTIPAECIELQRCVAGIRSLDLLSPSDMRLEAELNPAEPDVDIGERGERIAGYLHEMPEELIQERLVNELQKYFPNVVGLNLRHIGNNVFRLYVRERFADTELEIPSTHCNDGLLRVLGLLTELQTGKGLYCFDEIENGISIDVLDQLLKMLLNGSQQILMTTHSVIALNYIPYENVRLLYRDRLGYTHSGLLSDIVSQRKYFEYYEPGDALYFTSLTKVSNELADRESVVEN